MLYIFLDHEFSSKLRSIFHDVAQMFVQNKTSNEVPRYENQNLALTSRGPG